MSRTHPSYLVFALLFMAGCGSPPGRIEPIDLVPHDAIAVIELRWDAIQAHDLLRRLAPPDVQSRLTLAGLDDIRIESMVLFANGWTAATDTLLLAAPGIGERLVQQATSRGWPRTSRVRFESYDIGHNMAAAAMGSIAVIGHPAALAKMASTPRGGFRSREEYAALHSGMTPGDAVRAVIVWPDEARDAATAFLGGTGMLLQIGGFSGLGGLLQKLGVGRGFGLSCGAVGATAECTLAGLMTDESTAAMISGTLSLLQGMGGLAPAGSQAAAPVFTVRRTKSTVFVRTALR